MREYSGRTKRLIREWMTEAYERELYRELTKLDESFAEWHKDAISSVELSHRIHEWEMGPSRALFEHYNRGSQDLSVAYAIVVGILDEKEVPEELLEAIGGAMEFFRSLQERDELRIEKRLVASLERWSSASARAIQALASTNNSVLKD